MDLNYSISLVVIRLPSPRKYRAKTGPPGRPNRPNRSLDRAGLTSKPQGPIGLGRAGPYSCLESRAGLPKFRPARSPPEANSGANPFLTFSIRKYSQLGSI